MMDVHTDEFGYSEIDPPYLVKQDTMIGSGNLQNLRIIFTEMKKPIYG